MELSVKKSKVAGEIVIPGSKSHTIRAIYLAAMASGTSTIKMPLISQDTISCLKAASILGAWIKRGDDTIWRISGTGGRLLQPAKTMSMGNSGTGLRLFTSLAAMGNFKVTLDGDESLRSRGMKSLLDALTVMGAKIESTNGKCPLSVTGPVDGAEILIDGKTSQFLSSLLMVAPMLKHDTVIHVDDLHEKPYVLITLDWLKRANADVAYNKDLSRFEVKGGQKYSPFVAKIPADFSTAAFPLLASAVTGGEIKIRDLDFSDTQGDKAVFDYFSKMGVKIVMENNFTTIHPPRKLKAFDIDMNATPDAVPVMAVAGALADGISFIRNVPQARLKECDRIAAMASELTKMGAKIEELEDGLVITGGKLHSCTELKSFQDHRIAMALAIAAMTCEDGSIIQDAEYIGVTFPGFVEEFRALGANFMEIGF